MLKLVPLCYSTNFPACFIQCVCICTCCFLKDSSGSNSSPTYQVFFVKWWILRICRCVYYIYFYFGFG